MNRRLTTREQQVIELIGAGQSGRAIAERLGIAYDTVRKHRHSILYKLGLTSAAQLVAAAAKASPELDVNLDLQRVGVR